MEISNLSDAEFKTLVIRMLKELSEDLSCIKKIQSEMKDTLMEIESHLQGNNSRVDETENQADLHLALRVILPRKLRIKSMIWNIKKKKTSNENNKKKKESKKNEDSISSLWDNFRGSNVHIIGMQEGEKKEQKIGN